jgi:transposase InsO family protein
MWNEWNRWWSGRGAPGEGPPEEIVRPASKSENDSDAVEDVVRVESEKDPGAAFCAIPSQSENVDAPIPETLQPVRHAHEPDGATDFADEAVRETAQTPQPTPGDDLGADGPAEFRGTDDSEERIVGRDPVEELIRQGLPLPRGKGRARGRRLARPEEAKTPAYNPQQRLMILDCWQRSGLPAKDFATLVGISKHTLYAWKQRFTQQGPAGLLEQHGGAREGSRLPDLTQRTILLLKQAHPDWGCERISQMLVRGPALPASPPAVARVLREAGYELHESPTRPHPDKIRFFERARPSQLWQTDLFTFVLKRQNRRVYLVAFLDDHSRFLVSFGVHASQSTALVLEVLRAGIAAYGAPEEVLTDNGAQYVTWRGESAFHKELTQRGIRQIVAAPRHPQTLGKIERFWGTLWRECLETAVFLDLADARARIGHFIDWYNFQRTHSGIGGLVPADRFFGAAPEVLLALKDRVAANALELARNGLPKPPFYMTGQLGGKNFSLHAEGERVFLTREDGARQEVDLAPPASAADARAMPKAICPDGSPAAGLVSAAPPEPRDAASSDEPPSASHEDAGEQEGGMP